MSVLGVVNVTASKVKVLLFSAGDIRYTSFLVCHGNSELFSYPSFLVHGSLLMMMKFFLLAYDTCKVLFFLMEISKDVREKHGKHVNAEKYQSPIQKFGPRQISE